MLITSVSKSAVKLTVSSITVLPFWSLKNVKIFETIVPLTGTSPKEITRYEVKDLFMFTRVSTEETEYSTIGKLANTPWCINLTEYYATIKNFNTTEKC